MNTKALFVFILLLSLFSAYSFDVNKDEFYFTTDIGEGIVATTKELIYIKENYDDISIISRSNRPKNLFNNLGFVEFKLKSLQANIVEMNGMFLTSIDGPAGHNPVIEALKNNIKSISASTELSESINGKKNTYRIRNCLSRLCYEKEIGYYLTSSDLPWATNLHNDPKPIITITVNTEVSSLFILNGYVDFHKQSLFYNNARVKTIEITDLESNNVIGDFQFVDKVIYQLIKFPRPLKHFQLKIIDTYPGLKYSDLCISSIYLNKYNEQILSGDYGANFLKDLKEKKYF